MKTRNQILPLAAMAGLAFTASIEAAVIQTVSSDASQTAFSVSTSDLLHGLTGVGFGTQLAGGTFAYLNNGVHGGDNTFGTWIRAEITVGKTPTGVTYTLGTGDNGLGYDITSIASFAAWAGTFHQQAYTIEVQAVGGSFTTLYSAFWQDPGTANSSKIELTDDSGPLLATGIEAIRFTHDVGLGTPQDGAIYRELDVFGTSTVAVPEPSSLALLGLGGLAMLRRRRR